MNKQFYHTVWCTLYFLFDPGVASGIRWLYVDSIGALDQSESESYKWVLLLCVCRFRFITEVQRNIFGKVALRRHTAGHWRPCSVLLFFRTDIHLLLWRQSDRWNTDRELTTQEQTVLSLSYLSVIFTDVHSNGSFLCSPQGERGLWDLNSNNKKID